MSDPNDPSRADLDTYKKLLERDLDQLATVQGRAKAWLPALTAIAALAASVTILKGPESASELAAGARWLVAVLVAIALLLLTGGLLWAYRAAFGSPIDLKKLDVTTITGLYERYVSQLEVDREKIGRSFVAGLSATIVGTVLLFVAQVVTWFPPVADDKDSASYCLDFGAGAEPAQVEVDVETIDMSKLAEGVTVAACE